MSNYNALFACTRCFTRHPFEELSQKHQLCKECRGAFPVVKCTYCRSEFRQTNKDTTSTICKTCEVNVKAYGKPTACEYCNIIAAFIGNKCQRCMNSERKYGQPFTCEQCKQKCAFDRQDEDKKVDGKLLCWICTRRRLSFKQALAKTKQRDTERRAHSKMMAQKAAKNKEVKMKGHNKRPNRVDVTKLPPSGGVEATNPEGGNKDGPPNKMPRMEPQGVTWSDNNHDSQLAITQLQEQMASLQKQLHIKDATILSKDKMITELKAKHFTTENELRTKMNNCVKDHDKKVDMLSTKIKILQKEVATLSKSTKKERVKEINSNANSGSRTDSPSNTIITLSSTCATGRSGAKVQGKHGQAFSAVPGQANKRIRFGCVLD